LPPHEDRFDLGDEGRDLRSELRIVVCRIEIVQKLLADQVVERLRCPELALDVTSRLALPNPNPTRLHSVAPTNSARHSQTL
jgi:hypothetical protein